jgi:hypothetical protein
MRILMNAHCELVTPDVQQLRNLESGPDESPVDQAERYAIEEHVGLPIHLLEVEPHTLPCWWSQLERIVIPPIALEERLRDLQLIVRDSVIRDRSGLQVGRERGSGHACRQPSIGLDLPAR